MTTIDSQIVAALHEVCDPCSIAANAPVSILDMGLVREWHRDDDGNVAVTMAITSAGCTMGPNMAQAAEQLIGRIPGVKSAKVIVDPTYFWTPESMSEAGRAALDYRRQRSLARAGGTPQAWRNTKVAEK